MTTRRSTRRWSTSMADPRPHSTAAPRGSSTRQRTASRSSPPWHRSRGCSSFSPTGSTTTGRCYTRARSSSSAQTSCIDGGPGRALNATPRSSARCGLSSSQPRPRLVATWPRRCGSCGSPQSSTRRASASQRARRCQGRQTLWSTRRSKA
eukprot:Amastigsp_a72_6.p3 type:complete len:151 gc:universal Amastigsp_a72_6:622-170(-)